MNRKKKIWVTGLIILFILILIVAFSSIAVSFRTMENGGGKGMTVYKHEIEETGLSAIDIGYVSEGVVFYKTNEDNITIVENLRNNGKKAEISIKNGRLIVNGDKRSGNFFNLFSFGFQREWIEVYLPANYAGSLSITTVSGEIKTSDCWELSSFEGNCTSGNIYLEGMSAERVDVNSVSGRLEVKKLIGNVTANTTSGSVFLESDRIKGIIAMSTVSGNIKLKVPKDSGFTYNANTVSGRIRILTGKDGYDGTKKSVGGSYGKENINTVSAGTVSGKIELYY